MDTFLLGQIFYLLHGFKSYLVLDSIDTMIQNITFRFPVATQSGRDFFDCLKTILSEAPHTWSKDGITLSVLNPKNAYPVTNFYADRHSSSPVVDFDSDEILANLIDQAQPKQPTSTPSVTEKHDAQGAYYEVLIKGVMLYRLPIVEVMKRLQGHVTRVDHTGLNLPSKLVGRKQWNELVGDTAPNCNMYKYPTGEDWPFILPATKDEFKTGITNFPLVGGQNLNSYMIPFRRYPLFKLI